MPTHNNCLAVAIAGILLVALEIGLVISQGTDVTSSTVLTTSPASATPESSPVPATTFVATTPLPLTTTSFRSSAESSSFDITPSLVPAVQTTGTGVTTTSAIRSPAMSEPAIPVTTRTPTASPDITVTTTNHFPGTTDSGNETSFTLYVAIPLGSATFCAIFLLFVCLMCIWCKRMMKIRTESTPKEEEEVPTEMYVLENSSSKGDTLRFDVPDDSTKTFGVASTFANEHTPIFDHTTHVTPDVRGCAAVPNPELECSPEANEYVKFSKVSSLPRSYHLSIKHPAHQESQTPPVMLKPARSLSSINTQEFQVKRKLSSGNADIKSKVYAVPITTAGLIDQQQSDNLEQLNYTQHPTRTSSVGALYNKAESANSESKGNEGLYDVPRVTQFRRASDDPGSRNAVATGFQRNTANDSEPSSHYDIPKHALAMQMAQGLEVQPHPPDSDNMQSSEEHASSTVPTSTSGHYDIPKEVQASHSFSSGYKHRVNPQTAIQRRPTHPKVKPTPSVKIPKTQAVVDPFSTYDVPRKAATLPNISHTNAQGDTGHYDVPRRLTVAQNNKESTKPFLSGIMHSGNSTQQPFPDQVHAMPRFGDQNPHHVDLPTGQEKYIPQSADISTHDYQNVRRPPADTIVDDQDSDSDSEHLYDQPPLEFLEEVRQMAKKKQRSSEDKVVQPSNASQSNYTLKNVETPTNPNVLQKVPPPVKQKPGGKRPTAAKQL